MIAHYLFHFYNGNIEPNGIQPCYFLVVYTGAILASTMRRGIQPCYFWAVYTASTRRLAAHAGIQPCYFWAVYTHPSRQKEAVSGIQPCYFGVVYTSDGGGGIQPCYFRTLYTQHRHIQFPKVLVVASDPTNQPTEYSCFHDDHASPQALIPVIPSVLNLFRAPAASGHR